MNDALKGLKEMMDGINDTLKHSMLNLPPEQQAEVNKFSQEIMGHIPDIGEFMKNKKTAAQMSKEVTESNKKIMDSQKKMTRKYGDNSNRQG